MSIGNRVFLQKPEVAQELLDAFKTIPAANISDTMGRLVGMHPRIKLQSSPKDPINVGRALTIKTRSGDSLMLRKLYPEWNLQTRIPRFGHGMLVWNCSRHGLFWQAL